MNCKTSLSLGFFVAMLANCHPATAKQPNIILFMVDDLGWNHIGVQTATMGTANPIYETPNLTKLATNGTSFTHAYAQPNCAPTRAAMLTGQYPARVNNDVYVVNNLNRFGGGGITKQAARFRGPEQSEDVGVNAITIAEALKKNGYATAHIGKYHVGGHKDDQTLPESSGFDINIGGSSQGHQPTCFASKNQGNWNFKKTARGDLDRYAEPYSDAYVRKRNLPTMLVGTAKHLSDAMGDAGEDTIEKLVAKKQPFYLQFHTYAVHGPVRARPDLKQAAAKRIGKKTKANADYLGFIAGVDENLGRLLAAIEDPNGDGDSGDSIVADTLVIFTSDNGGTHASNAPLRGEKGMLTEGGIRVPLIASWPGKVATDAISHRVVHAIDYYPTFLELAGNRWMPPEASHPLDGESFAGRLLDQTNLQRSQPIFYLFPGYMDKRAQPTVVAIDTIGGEPYKLYYTYETDTWELYRLSVDVGESKNLVRTHAEIASTLAEKVDRWLRQEHPTWRPKYPIEKNSGEPTGPPPGFRP